MLIVILPLYPCTNPHRYPQILLKGHADITKRLELKKKKFEVETACFSGEMEAIQEISQEIKPSLSPDDTPRIKSMIN